MQVKYGAVDLGSVHLDHFAIDAAYDDSGQDLLCHDIALAVSCPLNAFAVATSKAGPGGGFGVEGDRLGITIPNLKDLLQTPRQQLTVLVGNDVALLSPDTDPGTGEALSCDVRGGPYPGRALIHECSGDKTATLTWDVRTSVTPCNNYLLSNRWGVQVSIGTEGFSTRTVRGKAYFRKDYLDFDNLPADSFRRWLFVPCPSTMQRVGIEVYPSENDTSIEYVVSDAEQNYGLGAYGITRIAGNVTYGVNLSIGGIVAAMATTSLGGGILTSLVSAPYAIGGAALRWLNRTADAGATGTAAAGALAAASGVNFPKANGLVRVWGQRGIDKEVMARAAIGVIQDRFRPLGTNLRPVSCYITQDVSSDSASFLEVRMEFLALNQNALKDLLSVTSLSGMNFLNTYSVFNAPPTVDFGPDVITPEMPSSNNCRGSWLGALATAALKASACTLPAAPVDPGEAEDAIKIA